MSRTTAQPAMNPQTKNLDSGVIMYDADLLAPVNLPPATEWFDPDHWKSKGLASPISHGRGTALVIKAPFGSAVLRKYLRGGWASTLSRSRYLFTGYNRSRPLQEFMVLQRLAEMRLPAPRPVAAMCQRHGLTATGAILTLEIKNVNTLEQVAATLDADGWQEVGATIRQFHDHGLVHADLNVRNILINDNGRVFLVDFDRACFRPNARRAFGRNLKRLWRSMVKSGLVAEKTGKQSAWMQLLKGYESSNPVA